MSSTELPTTQESSVVSKSTRSCNSCRRRKLKCDRVIEGCSSCAKCHIPCIYPVAPAETPKRKRGPYQKDRSRREKELEYAIRDMEAKYTAMESRVHRQESAERLQWHIPQVDQSGSIEECLAPVATSIASGSSTSYPSRQPSVGGSLFQLSDPDRRSTLTTTSGVVLGSKPVTDEPLSDRFWLPFSKDFSHVNQAVDESAATVQSARASISASSSTDDLTNARQALLLGVSQPESESRTWQPSKTDALEYWQLYNTRVEPMTRLLHPPSFAPKLMAVIANPSLSSRSFEALTLSICFASINSMTPAEIQLKFDSSKEEVLKKVELVVFRALARADVMTSRNLQTLQALVIYLLCLRRQENNDILWTLTGVAVRIAQLMDLAGDSQRSISSPLEVQLRKRLWWTICRLDSRSAEGFGFNPPFPELLTRDTLPLNINDLDLYPEATEVPPSRLGFTDMTLPLVGLEIMCLVAKVNVKPTTDGGDDPQSEIVIARKIKLVEDCRIHLQSRFLQYADPSRPFDWMTITFTRLMLNKCLLLIYHPLHTATRQPLSAAARDKVFVASVDTVQDSHALKVDPRVEKWAWFFRSYVQWHALAFVLAELCHRAGTPDANRAWEVLDEVMSEESTINIATKQSALWQPLHWLLKRARQRRTTISPRTGLMPQKQPSALSQPPSAAGYISPSGTRQDFGSLQSSFAPLDRAFDQNSSLASCPNDNLGVPSADSPANMCGHNPSDINIQDFDLIGTEMNGLPEGPIAFASHDTNSAPAEGYSAEFFEKLSSEDWMNLVRDWNMEL